MGCQYRAVGRPGSGAAADDEVRAPRERVGDVAGGLGGDVGVVERPHLVVCGSNGSPRMTSLPTAAAASVACHERIVDTLVDQDPTRRPCSSARRTGRPRPASRRPPGRGRRRP